ncbi:MAG: hypothetical protein HZC18_03685 [Candidatus Omnitrophica bacterium]|nr:hypothetical protein [Candidatus Omnitrophota bacterium]
MPLTTTSSIRWARNPVALFIKGITLFYNFHGGKEKTAAASVEQVQQCPYCTYVFISDKQGGVVMCPRCKSYIAGQAPSPRP